MTSSFKHAYHNIGQREALGIVSTTLWASCPITIVIKTLWFARVIRAYNPVTFKLNRVSELAAIDFGMIPIGA